MYAKIVTIADFNARGVSIRARNVQIKIKNQTTKVDKIV